jgi:multidrug efflux pump subunit AcrA (membrane-fusion protein)
METEPLQHALTLDRTLPGKAVLVSRVLVYSVVGLIVSAVAWAAFTHVDVVVDARGRLVVEGEPMKISVPEAGVAIAVPVAVGDHVAAGQVLLRLDPYRCDAIEAGLIVDLDAAMAELAIRRAQTLIPGSEEASLSQQQLVTAQGKVRSLQEQLASIRRTRQRLTLTAPAAGVITQIAVTHPGSNVPVDPPAVILMPDKLPLIADIRIPNASMRRLHPGDIVRLTFDAFPREDFGEATGRLLRIDPDSDDAGFYRAHVNLDRPDLHGPAGAERLRSGLQLNAKILVERPTLLMLLLNPLRKLSQPLTVGCAGLSFSDDASAASE